MILDTNGLSAMAEGEPALEPILRKAAQLAIPVIAWASAGMEFLTHASENTTSNG